MHPIPEKLLRWYDINARSLPWRSDPSPYKVWVSEIMLQQTQVETVIPYFQRFMERFPDTASLAKAEESEVLQVWEGLGYYSRARNLHKAARIILSEFCGEIPMDVAALKSLPGIGAYTAGAIASIAFGAPEPALDANIRRVTIRLLDLHEQPGAKTDEKLWEFSRQILPDSRVGDYNQALMDLGSAICKPKEPLCHLCPLNDECLAFQRGTQSELPLRKPKGKVPHKLVVAAVIAHGSKVLLARRSSDGMLGNLWEYPGGAVLGDTSNLHDALQHLVETRFGLSISVESQLGVYKHAYTHFRITLHAFACRLPDAEHLTLPPDFAWADISTLSAYPMGKVARLISRELAF
ncbi:MAG TPA: A/G-specific adenine glycosylase [Anaerolineaceae bacterium]|nr:A/G-specific adenine glycosylase [Anaerolineaceae bacterium]